ncbi:MAG: ATP synthase F1 subunit gamma [Planctomycetota bacterium]|nr:MAG: ATP synthase F1 subunit gamma [Planctomycetota bacterium]
MANTQELLKRRKTIANTRKITRTMELVASSKARKAQEAADASRPYAEALAKLVRDCAASEGAAEHPLLASREVKRVVLLVATSDRGLCGAFNANILRHALETIKAHEAQAAEVEIISLGKKGYSTLRYFGYEPAQGFGGIMDAPRYSQALEVIEPLMERYLAGEIDRVEVVYPRFINVARQEPSVAVLLPAGGGSQGGSLEMAAETLPAIGPEYFYSPSPVEMLEALIPQTVRTALFSTLLQTSAGEHNARRVAMKNATDAASDILKTINRTYNRVRQGKITQEIAEIVGAVEAMS